jgi:hypothetical protein
MSWKQAALVAVLVHATALSCWFSPASALGPDQLHLKYCTIAELALGCGGDVPGDIIWVTDGVDEGDCSTGGGEFQHECQLRKDMTWGISGAVSLVQHCFYDGNDPTGSAGMHAWWRFEFAGTLKEIWCEVTGGTSMVLDFQIDNLDGPEDVDTTPLTCVVEPGDEDTSLNGDVDFEKDDTIDIIYGTETGNVLELSACIRYLPS